MLLRVLEERELEQVGSSTPTKVNVRLIAVTNKNLVEKVSLGDKLFLITPFQNGVLNNRPDHLSGSVASEVFYISPPPKQMGR